MINKLPVEKLRKECDPNFMQCESTHDLAPLSEIIGQERAVRALKFGLGIKDHGFNMYVAGYPGTGRKTAVKNFVEAQAKAQPVPPDCCYVNNFANPYEPKAIQLPAGKGKEFRDDIKNFIENVVRNALPKAFESEDYVARRESTIQGLENQRKQLIDELNQKAQREGFVIQTTPIGLLLIPVLDGKPLSEEEMLALPQKMKDKIQEKREKLEAEFRNTMRQLIDMERKIHEALKKLNKEVALYTIGNQVESLVEKYKDTPEVTTFMRRVLVERKKDGVDFYWPANYLAKKCDPLGLKELSTGRHRNQGSMQYQTTLVLFGKCQYRPAIPYLAGDALYDFSGNIIAAAEESLDALYSDHPKKLDTLEEVQKYYCRRAKQEGFEVKCNSK